MRGALNTYQYNGRRYFRPALTGLITFEAVIGGGVAGLAKPLIGTVIGEIKADSALIRARSLVGSVGVELSCNGAMQRIRLPENQLFMRREKQDRYMRKEVDK